MGRPTSLKHNGPEGQSGRRPKGLPKRTSTRSSISSAHLSDRSTRFRHQPSSSSLSNRKACPKTLLPTLTPRLRPRDQGSWEPCSPLFSDRRTQSRLEPFDRGCPFGRNPKTCGERQGKAHKSKPLYQGPYPAWNSTLQPP